MITKHSDTEYIELRNMLARMGSLSIDMLKNSVTSLINADINLAEEVIKTDKIVDELDIKIDEQSMKIIALYEPKASDLRYIITALRIIVDLERIGDHAKNISKQAIKLASLKKIKDYIDLPIMADHAAVMVKGAIDSYFNQDEKKALEIIKMDSVIDGYQSQISRELITYIAEDVSNTKVVIKLINIVRRLERIADHAKNIAELVSFMVTGKVIRHTRIEDKDE